MRVDILERVTAFTTLGIRFWDAALDRPVVESLMVTARPVDDPVTSRPVRAFRTISGVYALMGLPGLAAVEHATGDIGSPPTRGFIVTVSDPGSTFLPIAFTVDLPLPYRGLFLGPGTGSSPEPSGFLVVSAPQRRTPVGMAAVRGELALAATGAPAAHTVVTVTDPDGGEWQGVADTEGRFCVLLPWPEPVVALGGSPGTGGGQPLAGQSWSLTIEAACTSVPLPILPGTTLPDYGAILAQPPTDIWADAPGSGGMPASDWTGQLDYGAELVPRTTGLSKLLVGPAPVSPPSSP